MVAWRRCGSVRNLAGVLRTLVLVAMLVSSAALLGAGTAAADPGHDGGKDRPAGEKCETDRSAWQQAQTVAGVEIQESLVCRPDKPSVVATSVKGTNNVPRMTLMKSGLARDAVVKKNDRDGDGDPDVIHVKLEIGGLNEYGERNHAIAPGVQPPFWVFAPKTRGMVREGSPAEQAIRPPSPTIRAEEGDTIRITVQNTHYFPHTIHFHGVDHDYEVEGQPQDGVPQTGEMPLEPGESRTYEFTPGQAGTMFYHCHVVPNVHVGMGLNGMFVIEEERDDNHVQTLNVGAGKVRHPSKGVESEYAAEYDMVYQGIDKELHQIPQEHNDPRVIAKKMNRVWDATERVPDYFILNGKSFPYTLRESQVIVEPDEEYRLRMLNAGSHTFSIHTHGHKFDIEAYDGVEVDEGQEVQRDVVTLSAAQRVDLTLDTTENGLDSYGPGVWFMHDHREQAVTTDGIAPGGTVSMITYERYLQDNGFPETGANLSKFFYTDYYNGTEPYWSHIDEERLGAPPENDSASENARENVSTAAGTPAGTPAAAAGGGGAGGPGTPAAGSSSAGAGNGPLALAGLAVAFVVGVGAGGYLRERDDEDGPSPRRVLGLVLVAGAVLCGAVALFAGAASAHDGTHATDHETAPEEPTTPTPANTTVDWDPDTVASNHSGGGDGGMSGDGGMDGMMMDMQMVPNGTVINENEDTPPGSCQEIRGNRSITVRAGHDYAEPGEMFSYNRTDFEFDPCTRVTVTLINEDEVRHQWMVHGLPRDTYPMGMFNIEVRRPGRVTGTFVTPADAGDYNMHCSLPQHEQKGMNGTITIRNTGPVATAAGAADSADESDAPAASGGGAATPFETPSGVAGTGVRAADIALLGSLLALLGGGVLVIRSD